jgi:UDP-4-amino-4-deoxy-L-arabinose-oxoglutarate aminotransferase
MINEGLIASQLEAAFLTKLGGTIAVACGSGSQALLLALRAVDVEAGDEVIVPTYVCAEVLATIEALGATAVIVDVSEDYLIDIDEARRARTPRCKAVVVPYVLGIFRDIAPLRSLGLPLIEDCAQFMPDRPDALKGDLAIFSFEATKVIAAGEGGLVLCRTESIGARLGALKRFDGGRFKLNLYPLSDILAALALSQLSAVPAFLARRRGIAKEYLDGLRDLDTLYLPSTFVGSSMFFRFPIRVRGKLQGKVAAMIEALKVRGVSARKPVDPPLHHLRSGSPSCECADALYDSTLSIPLYPALTQSDVAQVIAAVRGAVGDLLQGSH